MINARFRNRWMSILQGQCKETAFNWSIKLWRREKHWPARVGRREIMQWGYQHLRARVLYFLNYLRFLETITIDHPRYPTCAAPRSEKSLQPLRITNFPTMSCWTLILVVAMNSFVDFANYTHQPRLRACSKTLVEDLHIIHFIYTILTRRGIFPHSVRVWYRAHDTVVDADRCLYISFYSIGWPALDDTRHDGLHGR